MIHAALAQYAHLHRNPKLNVADHAVAAAVLAPPAAAVAQAEFPQQHRVPAFEDLGVRDARVRHVRVHAAGAVPGGARAGAPGYGFVVAEAFCRGGGCGEVAAEAEGEVVAVALGGGAGGEGEEDDVCDALGCEDVAADDGGAVGGREEGSGGDEDPDWGEAALV